jgi:4-hydroxybenzoate polyprenyltransferase
MVEDATGSGVTATVRAPARSSREPWRAVVSALRPHQWSKNLLLFAGIIFAAKIEDWSRWLEAGAAFVAYCAASSAAYLINDVRDVSQDRLHPVKRERAIARGELAQTHALQIAALLGILAFGLAAVLGPGSLLYLGLFSVLQVAYTLGLKRVVLVDVLVIAGLFVLRAAAGAEAVDVRISPWLLVCTALLALFLGLAKRRGELVLVGAEETPGRPVLEGYSLRLVDRLVAVVAAATIVAYALYALTARDSKAMAVTIPFVAFGVVRYLILVHRRGLGEEPEHVLLTDWPIILTVALWVLTAAAVLVWI